MSVSSTRPCLRDESSLRPNMTRTRTLSDLDPQLSTYTRTYPRSPSSAAEPAMQDALHRCGISQDSLVRQKVTEMSML
eukprot:7377443-Prymnesium_polylepis.1